MTINLKFISSYKHFNKRLHLKFEFSICFHRGTKCLNVLANHLTRNYDIESSFLHRGTKYQYAFTKVSNMGRKESWALHLYVCTEVQTLRTLLQISLISWVWLLVNLHTNFNLSFQNLTTTAQAKAKIPDYL